MRSSALAGFLYVRGLVDENSPTIYIQDRAEKLEDSLRKLLAKLEELADQDSEDAIQSVFYEAGKIHFGQELRWWFQVIYQIFLKQNDGPRLGQFVKLVSLDYVISVIYGAVTDVVVNDPLPIVYNQISPSRLEQPPNTP
jgi:lysyl-tRNA synthetase class I